MQHMAHGYTCFRMKGSMQVKIRTQIIKSVVVLFQHIQKIKTKQTNKQQQNNKKKNARRKSAKHQALASQLMVKGWMLSPKIRSMTRISALNTSVQHCFEHSRLAGEGNAMEGMQIEKNWKSSLF